MALNRAWHLKHRLGRGASLAERVHWHTAHAKACGCREMPKSIAAAIKAAAARKTKAKAR